MIDGPREGMVVTCSPTLEYVKVPVMEEGVVKDAIYQRKSKTEFSFKEYKAIPERKVIPTNQPDA